MNAELKKNSHKDALRQCEVVINLEEWVIADDSLPPKTEAQHVLSDLQSCSLLSSLFFQTLTLFTEHLKSSDGSQG